ncbi:adenylate/guanylate cyclase domain-containing protein [Brevibacillus dissolubilis]|uniref:adenylate/guanylate cyclase domain-containing protein n=1 Tax=Brevibacillus dissolubilis TaxID=1844116 RepID=UPI00111799A0|nr:adenylate/guanylate cyclase domain-containing protein [Brevibacillus dissolubilis]
MIKKWIFPAVLFMAAGLLGWFLYAERDHFGHLLSAQEPLAHVTQAVTDSSGHTYLMTTSDESGGREMILKLDARQRVVYRIFQQPDTGQSRYNFTDLAVDSRGYLYTLTTALSYYDLSVQSLQISRYTPTGELDVSLPAFPVTERMIQLGTIRQLIVHDDVLYFYQADDSTLTLHKWNPSDNKLSTVLDTTLPADTYITEVTGLPPGEILYATKKGQLYRVTAQGQSEIISIFDSYVPRQLTLDTYGHLYFQNPRNQQIYRLAPAAPERVEPFVLPGINQTTLRQFHLHDDRTTTLVLHDKLIRTDSHGQTVQEVTSYTYPLSFMLIRWGMCLLAFVEVVLIVYAFRTFYLHTLQKRLSLMIKQLMIFVPLMAGAMLYLYSQVEADFFKNLKDEVHRQLALIANSVDNTVEAEQLDSISSPYDYAGTGYQAMERHLARVFKLKSDTVQIDYEGQGFYNSVYKVIGRTAYVIIEEDEQYHPFDPVTMSAEEWEALDNGEIYTGMQGTPEEGMWMYALYPITDTNGKLMGIYEVGKHANQFYQQVRDLSQNMLREIILISLVTLIGFFITTYTVKKAVNGLLTTVNRMADGELGVTVQINTRDELAELGRRFNDMSGKIQRSIMDIEEMKDASFRFVPQQFFTFLGKENIKDLQLGDHTKQEMNILICYIRSFYHLSKSMTPEENFAFFNRFLQHFSPSITNHQGIVLEYGDGGIVSLFAHGSDQALQAAIHLREQLIAYNQNQEQNQGQEQEHHREQPSKPIDISIGLHRGPIMMGIIGTKDRLEESVISDDVNLTSVLQSLTVPLGASILITESLFRTLERPEDVRYRQLGSVHIDGLPDGLKLYDIYQGDPEPLRKRKEETRGLFENGIMLYQEGRFTDAREAFLRVLKHNEDDKAAQLYFYVCDEYFQTGVDAEWKGTLTW